MALSTLNSFRAGVRNAFPNDLISVDLRANYLLAGVVVQPSDQKHLVADCGECRTLPWSWQPLRLKRHLDVDPETLSLLHSLDVGLEPTD